MESYYLNNFEVKAKHSSEEVHQKWRKLCGVVKNPKRRFRFTANLSKRYEAQAMRRTNQVSFYETFDSGSSQIHTASSISEGPLQMSASPSLKNYSNNSPSFSPSKIAIL
nr:calcium-transporting ATPase 2, plasma membrane-type-like [Quercus suber]